MLTRLITSTGAPRLIVLFAGWAMDWRPFAHLVRPGYDIAVVWDYTSADTDWSFTAPYSEICIVAWSLGVSMADPSAGITAPIDHKVTLRLAVSGTLCPVDDIFGIPRAIFAGTLEGLTPRSLDKFYLRTAGSRQAFDKFAENKPVRDIRELKTELEIFLSRPTPSPADNCHWDRAIISGSDAIFPPQNQAAAWLQVPTDIIDSAHMPDFQRIFDKYIIDKDNTAEHFTAGATSYDSSATVQQEIAVRLAAMMERWGDLGAGARILETGCGTGRLSKKIARLFPQASLELWDLTDISSLAHLGTARRGDAEIMIRHMPDSSLQAIVSASTIQWFNSPRRFLEHCARVLDADGRLVFSTFGKDNMREVAAATGHSLPWMNTAQWQRLLERHFDVTATEEYRRTILFDSPLSLFRHLKSTGVNSLSRSDSSLRKAFAAMEPDDNGMYPLTYHPICFECRKKTKRQ